MEIRLSGKNAHIVALVDDGFLIKFPRIKLYLHCLKYVRTYTKETGTIYLHHLIVGKPGFGLEVDHINRNPLDNRACNLRTITVAENRKNKNPYRKTHKRYFGKYAYRVRSGRYQSQVRSKGKTIYCGTYDTAEEARVSAVNYLKVIDKQ